MKYLYETHCHTSPVSRCASKSAVETVDFYKKIGYQGLFITNHFLDGNVDVKPEWSYAEKLDRYFSDYFLAKDYGKKVGLDIFLGVEISTKGTDFLIYGLDIEWYYAHPEIMEMKKSIELPYLKEAGALVIQAHPYREACYIDHIRLYPRSIHGVEINNACQNARENALATFYADSYGLFAFAGSDNHVAEEKVHLAGVSFDNPIKDEKEFVNIIKEDNHSLFTFNSHTLTSLEIPKKLILS